jgi:hypothetical protein
MDDDDAEFVAGEFPPGLEGLSAEIERLAGSEDSREDIRDQVKQLADRATPFVGEARRAVGETDGLGHRIRNAVATVSGHASVVLSGTGSIGVGETVHAVAAALTVTPIFGADVTRGQAASAALTVTPTFGTAVSVLAVPGTMDLSDAGGAVDSLEVEKSGPVLDWLPPAYVFYAITVWLIVAGVAVVIARFGLSPDVADDLHSDLELADLALGLTVLFLEHGKRRRR